MTKKKVLRSPWFWLLVGVCGLLTWVGYDRLIRLKLYPVSGTVTLDGEPLLLKVTRDGTPLEKNYDYLGRSDYTVLFHPDPAKGNRNPWVCEGHLYRRIAEYQLLTPIPHYSGGWMVDHTTFAQMGAPLGWYKVTIRPEWSVPEPDVAKIRQYLKVDTTPLSIEVVKNPEPGHYDMKLESNNPH